jgi:hypothetical protein
MTRARAKPSPRSRQTDRLPGPRRSCAGRYRRQTAVRVVGRRTRWAIRLGRRAPTPRRPWPRAAGRGDSGLPLTSVPPKDALPSSSRRRPVSTSRRPACSEEHCVAHGHAQTTFAVVDRGQGVVDGSQGVREHVPDEKQQHADGGRVQDRRAGVRVCAADRSATPTGWSRRLRSQAVWSTASSLVHFNFTEPG